MECKGMERFAVMVKARYGPAYTHAPVWITHTVCDSLKEAREEQTAFEQSQRLLPGHGTTVCVYHSRDWEGLVR